MTGDMRDNPTTGKELRDLRDSKRIRQYELRKQLGWSTTRMNEIENGIRPPTSAEVAEYEVAIDRVLIRRIREVVA